MESPPRKRPLIDAARVVLRGFLLGLGFSVATFIVYYAAYRYTRKDAEEKTQEQIASMTGRSPEIAKAIVISDDEEQKHDGRTAILGKVTNTGTKPAIGLSVQANLFNHGKYVDQYSTYLRGTLAPGQSEYFKIDCGCKDTPPAEHDSYKLDVID
jgi:hypothetical protein